MMSTSGGSNTLITRDAMAAALKLSFFGEAEPKVQLLEFLSRKKLLLLIDNYDSFTYNLAHYLGELGAEVVVRRNDALSPKEAVAMRLLGRA